MTFLRFTLLLMCALLVHAAEWSKPAEVMHDGHAVAKYRAKIAGGFLAVQVTLEPGWHTFALDNKQRAEEALAGKKSLGIDQPTEIRPVRGFELAGPWFQTAPKDFSKAVFRWYAWGFEHQALFAVKVRHSGTAPAQFKIRGQACTETVCKNVDLNLEVSGRSIGTQPEIKLGELIQAR